MLCDDSSNLLNLNQLSSYCGGSFHCNLLRELYVFDFAAVTVVFMNVTRRTSYSSASRRPF